MCPVHSRQYGPEPWSVPLCKRQQSSTGNGASFLIAGQGSAASPDNVSWENKQEDVVICDLCQLREYARFLCPTGLCTTCPLVLHTEDKFPTAPAAVEANRGYITGRLRTEAEFKGAE